MRTVALLLLVLVPVLAEAQRIDKPSIGSKRKDGSYALNFNFGIEQYENNKKADFAFRTGPLLVRIQTNPRDVLIKRFASWTGRSMTDCLLKTLEQPYLSICTVRLTEIFKCNRSIGRTEN